MFASLLVAFRTLFFRAFASSGFGPSVSFADDMSNPTIGSVVWLQRKSWWTWLHAGHQSGTTTSSSESEKNDAWTIATWRHLHDTCARKGPTGSKRGRSAQLLDQCVAGETDHMRKRKIQALIASWVLQHYMVAFTSAADVSSARCF